MPSPTRRALCIGIDAYSAQPDVIRPLHGCVNDVTAMAALLQAPPYAFEHVRVVTNEQATRDGILAAFQQLVDETQTDDLVVIHYAGHGSQQWNMAKGEASGLDSTIVPVDSGRDPLPSRDIADKTIHGYLQALGAKTPYLTLFFDSCHSGTITRDADEDVRTRGVPPDTREVTAPLPAAPPPTLGTDGASDGTLGGRYVVIAGCRDAETSKEYTPENGTQPHGALTWFLLQELAKPGVRSYRDLYEAVAPRVTARYATQHPQLEGRVDGEVLGVTTLPPMQYVRVTGPTTDGDRIDPARGVIELGIGAVHAATAGSEYEIHRPGTSRPDASSRVGRVKIATVFATRSEATPLGDTVIANVGVGARAIEALHAFDARRLRVFVDPSVDAANADALRALMAKSGALVPAESSGYDVRVMLENGRWVMRDSGGAVAGPIKALDEIAILAENLDTYATRRAVLALDNPDQRSAVRGTVTLELLRRVTDATAPGGFRWDVAAPETPDGLVVYHDGEFAGFRVRHHHSAPLFMNLLYATANGEVGVAHPPQPKDGGILPVEQIAPAETFDMLKPEIAPGVRVGYKIGYDDFYPFEPGAPTDAMWTVKLFATTEEARFETFKRAAMRDVPPPIETLFKHVFPTTSLAERGGMDTSTDVPAIPVGNDEDWTTVSVRFVVRPGARVGDGPVASALAPNASAPNAAVAAPTALAAAAGPTSIARDAVDAALRATGATVQQSFRIAPATTTGEARDVAVTPPPDGFGQMLLVTNGDGSVSWHFADATDTAPGQRSVERRYRIPGDATATAADARGLLGFVTKPLVEAIVFPLVEEGLRAIGPALAERWEAKHRPYALRTFTADDYTLPNGSAVDKTMFAGGRALLMVHGTFSRAHAAFGALPKPMMDALHAHYGGRVFAFDHFTLAHDPERNVQELLGMLPDGVTLDIVCHSRGGLVARTLAERHRDRVTVGKVVFVGAPNSGTLLADVKYIGDFVDTFTNALSLVPPNGVTDVLEGVITVAKVLATGIGGGLPGLQAMVPNGDFLTKTLNASSASDASLAPDGVQYYALSSNYTPSAATPGLCAFVGNRLMDRVFAKADNDLVVPTASTAAANGSPLFPIAQSVVFSGEGSMSHTEFFAREAVHDKLREWLQLPA